MPAGALHTLLAIMTSDHGLWAAEWTQTCQLGHRVATDDSGLREGISCSIYRLGLLSCAQSARGLVPRSTFNLPR